MERMAWRSSMKCERGVGCEKGAVTKKVVFSSTNIVSRKRADTVGQPQSTEMGVPNMLSLKAKKLRKLLQAKVLLER